MGIRAWMMALHIRERYIAKLVQEARDAHDRIHRLEIANSQAKERFDLLEGQIEALRARWKGDRGGRPRKDAPDDLSTIPQGDKAALRRHFGIVKP